MTGLHHVKLDFCDCTQKAHHPIQLMRAKLFPATVINPKTAATYRLLEQFHVLRTQTKISAYEYYQTLARQTDNVSAADTTVRRFWHTLSILTLNTMSQDRYTAFLRISREWSHLKMLKRAGRGHDSLGVRGTAPGECAVECPACPQPGKNLPAGWEDAPNEKRCVDA